MDADFRRLLKPFSPFVLSEFLVVKILEFFILTPVSTTDPIENRMSEHSRVPLRGDGSIQSSLVASCFWVGQEGNGLDHELARMTDAAADQYSTENQMRTAEAAPSGARPFS